MWIFNNVFKDLFFIFLPGILSFALFALLSSVPQSWDVFASEKVLLFISLAFLIVIDTGHVYTTALRTWLHAPERKRSKIYLIAPVLFALVFSLWHYLKVPYLWSFVFYATIFHYIRQNYGILRWYEKLNQRSYSFSKYVIYLGSIIPFTAIHFRSDLNPEYYSANDLFIYPSPKIFTILLALEFLILAAWIILELKNKSYRETSRIGFLFSNTLLYGLCFLPNLNAKYLLACFVMAHGVPYLFLMTKALKNTQPRFNWSLFNRSLFVFGFAALFGLGEYLFEENFLDVSNSYLNYSNIIQSTLIGVYLIPLFCHFYFDAVIWKKDHPEAHLVYK